MVGALRLSYQRFSSSFVSSRTRIFGPGNPSSRHINSEIPAANQPNVTVDYLINSCGLSPQDAASASTKVKLQNPKRADSILAFLGNYGFSKTQISMLVRSRPKILAANPEKTLAPKIDFLINVGLSREDLVKLLAYNPILLESSLEKHIVPSYNFLRELISQEQVVGVMKYKSWVFNKNFSKDIKPNIELLRELGVPQARVSFLLAHHSQVLMHNLEDLAQVANEVKKMGFDVKKSTFVEALRALSGKSARSAYNRNREIYKNSWSWSDDDIDSAFRRKPECMIISEKKIMQIMGFLVNKMGWSPTRIAAYPVVLSLSLEKRIIPRCCVVKVLMSKGLIDENLSLGYVMQTTEKLFLERFLTRYISQLPKLLSVYEGELDWEDI